MNAEIEKLIYDNVTNIDARNELLVYVRRMESLTEPNYWKHFEDGRLCVSLFCPSDNWYQITKEQYESDPRTIRLGSNCEPPDVCLCERPLKSGKLGYCGTCGLPIVFNPPHGDKL